MGVARRITVWTLQQLGGRASAQVVAVFAGVFALDSADKGLSAQWPPNCSPASASARRPWG